MSFLSNLDDSIRGLVRPQVGPLLPNLDNDILEKLFSKKILLSGRTGKDFPYWITTFCDKFAGLGVAIFSEASGPPCRTSKVVTDLLWESFRMTCDVSWIEIDCFFRWDGPKMRQVCMYIHAHSKKRKISFIKIYSYKHFRYLICKYCSEIGEISRVYPQPANGTSSYVDRVYVVWIGCGKCVQLGKTHGSFQYRKCCANLEIKGANWHPWPVAHFAWLMNKPKQPLQSK